MTIPFTWQKDNPFEWYRWLADFPIQRVNQLQRVVLKGWLHRKSHLTWQPSLPPSKYSVNVTQDCGCLTSTFGVENVYRTGLTEELIGRTKTANHT